MRIQLVGGITNVDNYVNLFARAEMEAYQIDGVTEVVNPCNLPHDHDKTWESYMVECLNSIDTVDAIFLLRGWQASDGARLEYKYATEHKKIIYFQT